MDRRKGIHPYDIDRAYQKLFRVALFLAVIGLWMHLPGVSE